MSNESDRRWHAALAVAVLLHLVLAIMLIMFQGNGGAVAAVERLAPLVIEHPRAATATVRPRVPGAKANRQAMARPAASSPSAAGSEGARHSPIQRTAFTVAATPPSPSSQPVITTPTPAPIEVPTSIVPSEAPAPAPPASASAVVVAAEPSAAPATGPAAPGSSDAGQGTGASTSGAAVGSGASGTGSANGGAGTGGSGLPFGLGTGGGGGPRHIVYVLDMSPSMVSRIATARQELCAAISSLGDIDTFNVVTFGGEATRFQPEMAAADKAAKARAIRFLSDAPYVDYTNLEAALRASLSLEGVDEVVIVTDGVPTIGETDFGKLARLAKRLNSSHVRIDTVGLVGKNPDGTDQSFDAARLLRQISRESGGSSRLVPLGVAVPE